MAIRGFVLASTGWEIQYINALPEEHLLFAYHWCKKKEEDYWKVFAMHMGTVWSRTTLEDIVSRKSGEPSGNPNGEIFVPLALSFNPDLPKALLGVQSDKAGQQMRLEVQPRSGDGLATGMAIPADAELVNMADLPKEEFIGLIRLSGGG